MVLEDIGEWLTTNPAGMAGVAFCTIGGLIFGIWGLIATFRGLRHRIPCYAVRGNNLISNLVSKVPEVEVKFPRYGGPVENLTVTKLLFYNRGREAIKKGDMAKTNPLTIRVKEGAVILDVSILYSKTENQVSVQRSEDRSHAKITFDYFGHREGAVIQIIHTGTSSDDMSMDGIFINAHSLRKMRFSPGWVMFILWFAALLGLLVAADIVFSEKLQTRAGEWTVIGIMAYCIPVTVIRFWDFKTRRPPLSFMGRVSSYGHFKVFWD